MMATLPQNPSLRAGWIGAKSKSETPEGRSPFFLGLSVDGADGNNFHVTFFPGVGSDEWLVSCESVPRKPGGEAPGLRPIDTDGLVEFLRQMPELVPLIESWFAGSGGSDGFGRFVPIARALKNAVG